MYLDAAQARNSQVNGAVRSARKAVPHGPQLHRSGQPCSGAPPGSTLDGLPASPRTHAASGCHHTVPRHVTKCDTSTRVVGVVWTGREASRTARNCTTQGHLAQGLSASCGGSSRATAMVSTLRLNRLRVQALLDFASK